MSVEVEERGLARHAIPLGLRLEPALKALTPRQIRAIDEALAAVGDYGEVRLIVNRGKLRFVQTLKSEDLGSGE